MAEYNPEGIARAELGLVSSLYKAPSGPEVNWREDRLYWLAYQLGQKNRVLNRYAAFLSQYAHAIRLPWKQFEPELDRLRRQYAHSSYGDWAIDPFGTMFVQYLIESQLKAGILVEQMRMHDSLLRLNSLLVRVVAENVKDDEIPGFLTSVDPSLYDPIADTPMKWRESERKIYGTDPRGPFPYLWPSVTVPTNAASSAYGKLH
jgi:hypothetical protein